jgi:hypothetical protein
MGGTKMPIAGLRADSGSAAPDDVSILGGGDAPGSIGVDDAIPLDVSRTIKSVTKDWEPPRPTTTPEIVVHGATIPEVFASLNSANPGGEWGSAGGVLRTDAIPDGNDTNLTLAVHAGLILRLPRWAEYGTASATKKAEWDRMFAKLTAHENRHMAIAIEEANQLARDLIGKAVSQVPALVTEANRRMQARQERLDADTENGAKPGVPFGDVILNDVD